MIPPDMTPEEFADMLHPKLSRWWAQQDLSINGVHR